MCKPPSPWPFVTAVTTAPSDGARGEATPERGVGGSSCEAQRACGSPEMATSTSAVASLSLGTQAMGPALGSGRQTAAAAGTGDSERDPFPPPPP